MINSYNEGRTLVLKSPNTAMNSLGTFIQSIRNLLSGWSQRQQDWPIPGGFFTGDRFYTY